MSDAEAGPRVETGLVYAHGLAALATLFVSVGFGIFASIQLLAPETGGGVPWLSWGRIRYAHTQGIMLGWLGNAFFAFLYHAVPILSGRTVTSAALGRWLFALWNFAVLVPGWILVVAGVSQPLEWAEFPIGVDAFVIMGLGLAAVQFLPAFFSRRLDSLYVSSWYIIGSLVFTLLAYPMGNIVPEVVAGAQGAAFSGLWIHDAVGLFVTPLAVAILYFVIPAASGRPIYSHFLSMLGFWLLFLVYPLNGTHHYVYSVIPMEAQVTAIAASAILGVTVILVVFNLLMSLRGSGLVPEDAGLKFVAMSTIFYLIVSIQGSLQAQMAINQAVHFSDWVIGHSHLAMLGFATFAAAGGLVHAWQRIPWARYNARAMAWSYWLLLAGVVMMVVSLTAAGIVEAQLWQSDAPWLESVRAARPFWMHRSLAAIPITAGFIALLAGLMTGPRGAGLRTIEPAAGADASGESAIPEARRRAGVTTQTGRSLRMAYMAASIAGVAFFVMSVVLLGVWPGRVLERQIRATSPERPLRLTVNEERGRAIYSREGCAYCHTQQVRFVHADMQRFGAPTLAWETRFDFPHLWGTRRIGPDLARAGSVRTDDWQFTHLFAPRSVVADSVMPSYAWLFEGAPDRPTQGARDLVAYLQSLGRARELSGPEGDARARERCNCPDDSMLQMAFASTLDASPARTRRSGTDMPEFPTNVDEGRGRLLYAANCASCHGPRGAGDGPGAASLLPAPSDLTAHEYTRARLVDALWNGVAGTAMQAWRDHPPGDLAAIARVVQGFHTEQDTAVPDSLVAIGERVYAENCVQCHGPDGRGDGSAAGELVIAPTNFRAQRPTLDRSLRALREGIRGTRMASWTGRLSESEIVAVAAHVRLFFEANGGR